MNQNNGYQINEIIIAIDSYKPVEGDWLKCPCCDLVPRVWVFNNGRSTACGCWNTTYDHFSIHAESIMSILKRTKGDASEYNNDDLRKNWNIWAKDKRQTFAHAKFRVDGRW